MLVLPYTAHDVRSHFDRRTLQKAEDYITARRIREPEYNSGLRLLSADIKGTDRTPYHAEVVIQDGGRFDATCTCPVGEDCKHTAALLVYALDYPNRVALDPGAAASGESHAILEQNTPQNTNATAGEIVKATKSGRSAAPALPALDAATERWLHSLQDAAIRGAPRVAETGADVPGMSVPRHLQRKLIYTLDAGAAGGVRVQLYSVPATADNTGPDTPGIKPYHIRELFNANRPRFITDEDIAIGGVLGHTSNDVPPLLAEAVLHRVIATGRAWWQAPLRGEPLRFIDAPQDAVLDWMMQPDGRQSPQLRIGGDTENNTTANNTLAALLTDPPYYVDPVHGHIGPLELPVPLRVLREWLTAPALSPRDAVLVQHRLQTLNTGGDSALLPAPRALRQERRKPQQVTPHLTLTTRPVEWPSRYGWYNMERDDLPVARLGFCYDGSDPQPFGSSDPIALPVAGETLTTLERNRRQENEAARQLNSGNLTPLPSFSRQASIMRLPQRSTGDEFVPRDMRRDTLEDIWLGFMLEEVPRLRSEGFTITIAPDFPYNAATPDDWYSDLEESTGIDWFEFHMGVTLDGEKVDLVPPLLKLLRDNRGTGRNDGVTGFITGVAERKNMLLNTPDGRLLVLPGQRVAALLRFLLTIGASDGETLKVSRHNAVDLLELQAALAASQERWFQNSALRNLGQALKQHGGIPPAPLPKGLNATLRSYQHEGYTWLNFLRQQKLGGILADDMGLGKTLQALAYIQNAKEAGELAGGKPVLVIAPTSLVFNWQNEATRFCPDLKVLPLQGLERRGRFGEIAGADIVISTYALLSFDKDELLKHIFHTIILDEAQYIKNAKAKSTLIAAQLRAEQRFCLSGTPLENHLGEVWSLFNFLMPGFLGDAHYFQKHYRQPIEKLGDDGARSHLLKRVQPFMLRRTKEQVATELPPKTEMIQYCELSGPQRDVYEAVRLRMHKKVREEIAERGLARSQIIVLDALLKLRQVCCHPPLLKAEDARKVKGSAKLEGLLELLETLLDEGRKIVLFSQFVEMLKVIAPELDARKVPFVMLTGDSKNRGELVNTFQNGPARVFLVSLKAGGVGLNLTAADTVIHYDPWWNPAAERQAADRVYRIGQDKPVFVYKLIARDTVEEKILALQQRKQELADCLFDAEGGKTMARLTPGDVEDLLAA
jgi:superfamily II DNA or RNA helicase